MAYRSHNARAWQHIAGIVVCYLLILAVSTMVEVLGATSLLKTVGTIVTTTLTVIILYFAVKSWDGPK